MQSHGLHGFPATAEGGYLFLTKQVQMCRMVTAASSIAKAPRGDDDCASAVFIAIGVFGLAGIAWAVSDAIDRHHDRIALKGLDGKPSPVALTVGERAPRHSRQPDPLPRRPARRAGDRGRPPPPLAEPRRLQRGARGGFSRRLADGAARLRHDHRGGDPARFDRRVLPISTAATSPVAPVDGPGHLVGRHDGCRTPPGAARSSISIPPAKTPMSSAASPRRPRRSPRPASARSISATG